MEGARLAKREPEQPSPRWVQKVPPAVQYCVPWSPDAIRSMTPCTLGHITRRR